MRRIALIDVLLIIVYLAILAAVIVPSLGRVRGWW